MLPSTFDVTPADGIRDRGGIHALLLWRSGMRQIGPAGDSSIWTLFAGALACLWIGAWYGGELVYRFGVGILLPAPVILLTLPPAPQRRCVFCAASCALRTIVTRKPTSRMITP